MVTATTLNILLIIFVLFFSFYYFTKEKTKKVNEYIILNNGKFQIYFENKEDYDKYYFCIARSSTYWSSLIINDVKIKLYPIFKDYKSTFIVHSYILSSDLNNLTNKGELNINNKVFDDLTDKVKVDVLTHEIAHILGIGNKWDIKYDVDNGPYLDKDKYPLTMTAYVSITGVDNSLGIPVENEGGKGVANIHWENNDRFFAGVITKGLKNELLTSSLENPPVMSLITLKNLEDLGWNINDSNPENINFDLPRRLNPFYINV